ncbi:flagellar basal body-associated protein FliL [Sulfurospirillum sp. 1307]|jgi:flagellar basal body-associated protein FliL
MGKILKISLVVILLVAIVYMIVALFFANSSKVNSKYKSFGSVVSPSSSYVSKDELEVPLEKILIGLHKGPYKYMKAEISLRMKDKNSKKSIEKALPRVRDILLRYSSAQDSAKLATTKGKEDYKEGVKNVLYDTLGVEVEGVYFRNFVLAQ